MNQIALQPTSILPAPITPAMDREIQVLTSKLDPDGLGHSIAVEDAPSEDTRGLLKRRVMRIDSCLVPVSPRDLTVEIAKLFGSGLKSRSRTDEEADLAFGIYEEVLSDVPAFAVSAAAMDFLKGSSGDREWMPTPPDLRAHALSKVRPWAAERQRIVDVLNARVRPPLASSERRAAVVAMAQARMKDMREAGRRAEAERVGRPVAAPEDAVPATLEQIAAGYPKQPVVASQSLRKSLGLNAS